MLPIVDKPLIQYAVDEALSAAPIPWCSSRAAPKRAIEDHFDSNPELEAVPARAGKQELLRYPSQHSAELGVVRYIRQSAPWGWAMRSCARGPSSATRLSWCISPMILIDAPVPCLKQMVDRIRGPSRQRSRRAKCPQAGHDKYGIVTLERHMARASARYRTSSRSRRPDRPHRTLAVVGAIC